MTASRRVANVALLVSIGIVLGILESTLPPLLPVPGARLGLANIASVTALMLFGPGAAFEVTVVRCLLTGLIRGSMIGLFLGLGAGIASVSAMIIAHRVGGRHLSVIGVSIAGAAVHNATQIWLAQLLIQSFGLMYFLPYLLFISIPTGLFVGAASWRVSGSLEGLSVA